MADRDTSISNRTEIDDEYDARTRHQFDTNERKNGLDVEIRITKERIQHGLCDRDHSIRPTEMLKEPLIMALKLGVAEVLKKKVCTYEEISKVSDYGHKNIPIFLPRDVYMRLKNRLMKTRFRCVGDEKNINRLMLSIETVENEVTEVVVDGITYQFDTHILCGSALISHELVKYYSSIDSSPEPFRNIKRIASYNRFTGMKYSIFEFVWNSDRYYRPRVNRNIFSDKTLEEFMSNTISHYTRKEPVASSSEDRQPSDMLSTRIEQTQFHPDGYFPHDDETSSCEKQTCSIDDLLSISKTYPSDQVMVANALKSLIVTDSLYELVYNDISKTFRDYLENKHVQVVEVPEIRSRVDQDFMSRSDKLTGFCVRNIDIFIGLRERLSKQEMDRYDSTGTRLKRNTFTFRLDTSVPNNLFVSKYVTCKISDILMSVEVMEYVRHFYENMVLFNKGITDITMKRRKRRDDEGAFKYSIDLVFKFDPIEQVNEDISDEIDMMTIDIGIVKI